jgi:hypothetical protein
MKYLLLVMALMAGNVGASYSMSATYACVVYLDLLAETVGGNIEWAKNANELYSDEGVYSEFTVHVHNVVKGVSKGNVKCVFDGVEVRYLEMGEYVIVNKHKS